jgi:hypothetical protein
LEYYYRHPTPAAACSARNRIMAAATLGMTLMI